jgi:addiction module HigA family antidote
MEVPMLVIEREPTSPGEILEEEYLRPLNMTQKQLADHLGCDVKVVNRIVNNKTSISAEMAIKLSSTFGTSPEFWLNAQQAVDIYRAKRRIRKIPEPLIQIG